MLAVAVAAAAVTIAMVGPSATAGTDPAAAPATYDGRTLLWGLFFGVGPVAAQYPKLALTNIDETPENLSTVAGVIDEAESRSPGFLEQFGSAMYSDDPPLIAEVAAAAIVQLPESVARSGTGSAYGPPIDDLFAIVNGKPHGINSLLLQWAAAVATKLSPAA